MSKSPARTRAERGQSLKNIWTHLTWHFTPQERLDAGISEDRLPEMNVLRALDVLSARGARDTPAPFTVAEIDAEIHALAGKRFFGCCTHGCRTHAPTCDNCVRLATVQDMLRALRARVEPPKARVCVRPDCAGGAGCDGSCGNPGMELES